MNTEIKNLDEDFDNELTCQEAKQLEEELYYMEQQENKITLTRKLTLEEQQEILHELFGFVLENEGGDSILYTFEGHRFYSQAGSSVFDFSTLAGIFSYQAYLYKEKGKKDSQNEIRKAIGL
jgi:hypothetical protein